MDTAIYARVSTTDQNCDLQLSELREYAKRRGWRIVGEYVDTGWSGAKASRPQLDKLMADAARRKFAVILAWKIDRFSRSTQHFYEQLGRLTSWGVRFIAVTQGIDTDQNNPMSRFMLHILSAVAEFERDIIIERVTAGVRSYRAAYGAGRVGKHRHSKSGKDLPHGRPRAVFDRVRAAEMRGKGTSIRDIARAMNVGIGTVHRLLAAGVPKS